MGDKLAKCPPSDRDQFNLLNRKIREENDLLRKTRNSLKNSGQQNPQNEKIDRIQVEEDLFANADIIAVTLNSSMNGQMEKFFVKKLRTRGKKFILSKIWKRKSLIFFFLILILQEVEMLGRFQYVSWMKQVNVSSLKLWFL